MPKAHHAAKSFVSTLTGLLLAGTALAGPAMAGPSGGVVTGGAADIAGQGSDAVTINQHSNRVVIEWQNFDTQSHESVNFNQIDSNSIALNRILSGSPTQFNGALNANGNVIVMNANGVVFGNSSRVDVNGLIATTANVSTDSFMNDAQIRFDQVGNADASVINHGVITAREAGLVGFVAPHVENSGTINARLGKVQLSSGNRFTFDLYGDGLVEIAASDAVNSQLVHNSGTINADGGLVQLQASAAKNVVDALVNNTGILEARSVSHKNGVIILGGNTATTMVSGTVNVSGKNASETGGRIQVTGKNITTHSASIDASGHSGGGDVRIGGGYKGGENIHRADMTTVDHDTTITVDATHQGDGGKIVVWSNDLTNVAGTLSAKGGSQSGDGGLIETSSKGRSIFQNTIDINTSASHGNTGLWYIDPTNFTIADAGGDITTATLAGQLAANNITIETADAGGDAGDIFVEDALSWNSDRILTLNAHRNIDISAAITNTSGGSLVLRADKLGSGTGTVNVSGAGSVSMTGGGRTDVYYNPSAYTTPTDYSGSITGDHTVWMLVNDINQLQAINTDNTTRAGSYALGRDIDASDTVNWNSGAGFVPIGDNSNNFTGKFDGLNHLITALTIHLPTTNYGGFFGRTNGTIIQNVGLEDSNITGNAYVGGLIGASSGSTINHAYVTGVVTGNSNNVGGLIGHNISNSTINYSYTNSIVTGSASNVGGLAGSNNTDSVINYSYATGTVTGSGERVGGLVGYNNISSLVSHSYATGAVTGNAGYVGGLTGYNNTSSVVSHSYATGPVMGGGSYIGGIVGLNYNNSAISYSYATGTVTGNAGSIGGLVGFNGSSTISYSYATGAVTGNASYVGGLVGYNNTNSTISYSYATGAVTGSSSVGGLVGSNYNNSTISYSYATGAVTGTGGYVGGLLGLSDIINTVTNSYWDVTTTGRAASSGGGVGLTSTQARQQASYIGWDFTNDWYMINGETRPFGRWEFSTTISNAHQLQLMAMDLDADYTLSHNIDFDDAFTPVSGFYSDMWGSAGFVSIGNNANRFTGQFDGQNHIIDGLTIIRNGTSGIGLFGFTNNAVITRIGLYDVKVRGRNHVGALVGFSSNNSHMSYSYATGNVNSSNMDDGNTGGLIGKNEGTITHSYAHVNIAGGFDIGGLVGENHGIISHSYATGNITHARDDRIGGLVGWNTSGGEIHTSWSSGLITSSSATNMGGLIGLDDGTTVSNSYWDMDTSGMATSAGGAGAVGLTSAQMKQMDSFVGWDIGNTGGTGAVWRIYEGQTAPLLRHFMTALTVTAANAASIVYDGSAYSGGNGVTWLGFKPGEDVNNLNGVFAYGGTAQGAVNAGSYAITPTGYYSGQQGYDIIAVSGALTITPRDITVTADAASRVYGNTNPTFTYTVGGNGLVNGDTLSGALESAATVPSDVGDYAITVGDLGHSNYTITSYTAGTLSITQRLITITADALSRVYGNANPSFTYTVGGDGLANGDTLSGVLASAATVTSDIGDYAITQGTLTADSNYSITSYTGADLSVTQRLLTINAHNKFKFLGQANQPLTYTVGGQGLVNGDTMSGSLFTAAGIASPNGNYAITQGSVAVNSANYATTFNPGVLTVVVDASGQMQVPTIETGRQNSIMTPQPVPNTNREVALITGVHEGVSDLYNFDITQSQINYGEEGGLNNVNPSASDRLMSNFYKIYFTRELLQQLGYR